MSYRPLYLELNITTDQGAVQCFATSIGVPRPFVIKKEKSGDWKPIRIRFDSRDMLAPTNLTFPVVAKISVGDVNLEFEQQNDTDTMPFFLVDGLFLPSSDIDSIDSEGRIPLTGTLVSGSFRIWNLKKFDSGLTQLWPDNISTSPYSLILGARRTFLTLLTTPENTFRLLELSEANQQSQTWLFREQLGDLSHDSTRLLELPKERLKRAATKIEELLKTLSRQDFKVEPITADFVFRYIVSKDKVQETLRGGLRIRLGTSFWEPLKTENLGPGKWQLSGKQNPSSPLHKFIWEDGKARTELACGESLTFVGAVPDASGQSEPQSQDGCAWGLVVSVEPHALTWCQLPAAQPKKLAPGFLTWITSPQPDGVDSQWVHILEATPDTHLITLDSDAKELVLNCSGIRTFSPPLHIQASGQASGRDLPGPISQRFLESRGRLAFQSLPAGPITLDLSSQELTASDSAPVIAWGTIETNPALVDRTSRSGRNLHRADQPSKPLRDPNSGLRAWALTKFAFVAGLPVRFQPIEKLDLPAVGVRALLPWSDWTSDEGKDTTRLYYRNLILETDELALARADDPSAGLGGADADRAVRPRFSVTSTGTKVLNWLPGFAVGATVDFQDNPARLLPQASLTIPTLDTQTLSVEPPSSVKPLSLWFAAGIEEVQLQVLPPRVKLAKLTGQSGRSSQNAWAPLLLDGNRTYDNLGVIRSNEVVRFGDWSVETLFVPDLTADDDDDAPKYLTIQSVSYSSGQDLIDGLSFFCHELKLQDGIPWIDPLERVHPGVYAFYSRDGFRDTQVEAWPQIYGCPVYPSHIAKLEQRPEKPEVFSLQLKAVLVNPRCVSKNSSEPAALSGALHSMAQGAYLTLTLTCPATGPADLQTVCPVSERLLQRPRGLRAEKKFQLTSVKAGRQAFIQSNENNVVAPRQTQGILAQSIPGATALNKEEKLQIGEYSLLVPKGSDLPSTLTFLETELSQHGFTVGMTEGKVFFQRRQLDTETFVLTLGAGLAELLGFASEMNNSLAQPARRSTQLPLEETLTFTYTVRELYKNRKLKFSIHLNAQTPLEGAVVTCNQEFANKNVPLELTLLPDSTFKLSILEVGSQKSVDVKFSSNQVGAKSTGLAAVVNQPYNLAEVGPELAGQTGADASAVLDGKAVESTGNILNFDDLRLEISGELQTIDLSFKPNELGISGSFDWLLAPEPDPQKGFPAHVARIRGSLVSPGPGQLKLLAAGEPGMVSAVGELHSLERWPELLSLARPDLGRYGFSSRPSKPQSAMDTYCATGFIPAGAIWVPVLPLRSDLSSVPPLTAAYSGQSVSVFLLEAGDHDPVTCTFPQPLQDLILVADKEPMLPGTSRQQAQAWLLGQQGDSLLLLRLGSEEEECSVDLPGLECWYPSHQEDQEAGLRLLVVRKDDPTRFVEVWGFEQDADGELKAVLKKQAKIAFEVEAIGSGNPAESVYLANLSHEIVEWQWDQGPSAAIPTKVGTIHSVLVQQELVVAVGESGAQFISSAKTPSDPIDFAGLLSARWCGPGEIVLAGSQMLVRVHHSDSESEIENLVQLNAPLATFAGVFHLEDGLALAGGGDDAIDVWMAERCLVVSERELSCDLGLTTKLPFGNSEPKRELRLAVTGGHGLRASLHWKEGQADQRWSAHARIIQGAYHCFELARSWQTAAGSSGALVFWIESGGTQDDPPKLGACLLIEHIYSKQSAKFKDQQLSGPQVSLKIITSSKENEWVERDLTTWLLENDSQAKERIHLMLHEQSLPAGMEEPRAVVASLVWSVLDEFEVQGMLLLKPSWNGGEWSFTLQESAYAAVPVLHPPPTTDAEFLVDLGIPVLGGAPQLFDLVAATLDTNRPQTWLRAESQGPPFPKFVPIASVGLDLVADSQVYGLGLKLPISVPSLVHRRLFGARLRAEVPPNSSGTVGDQDHPYVVLGNAANSANSVYSVGDLYYGTADNQTRYLRVQSVAIATRRFSKENNQPGMIFNPLRKWHDFLDDLKLDVGDQLLIPPVSAASWVCKGKWLLCPLTALPGTGGLAVINEALWVRASTVNDSSIRSENLLSLQRLAPKPVGSDPDLPSLSCVISLTTPGIEPILKDEDCRSWLLRSGAAGVALLRSLTSTRTKSLPASYRFIPSPFFERPNEVSLTAQDLSFSQNSIVVDRSVGQPVGQLARDFRCLGPSQVLANLRADTSGGFHFEKADWSPWDVNSGQLASTLLRVARLRVADLEAWRKGEASLVAFEAPAYKEHASLWQIPPAPAATTMATFMPAKIETRYSADKAGAMTHHKLQPVLSASGTFWLGTHHEFAMRDPMQFQPPRGASIQFIDPPKAKRLPPDPIPPGFAQLNLTWKEVLGELPVDLKLEKPFTYTGEDNKWPEPNRFKLNEARLFMLVAVVGDEIIDVGLDLPYVPCDKAPKFYLISQIDILEQQVLSIGGKDALFEVRFNDVTATKEQFLLLNTELGEPWRVWQIVLPSRPLTFKMNWCFSKATTQLPHPTDEQIAEIEKGLVFLKERPIRLIPTLTAPKFAAVLSGIGTVNMMRQYERTLLFGRAADPDSGTAELTNAQKFVYSRSDRETPLIHLPEPEESIAYHLSILKYLTNGQVLFQNKVLKTE